MKHIKLFEQMDEEESWWDEESEFDNLESKLKIVKYVGSNGDYYITDATIPENGMIKTFNDVYSEYRLDLFDFNPIIKDTTRIFVFDYNGVSNNLFQYKDLPKEIKDRLI